MTTTRLIRIAVSVAIVSTACTLAGFFLMFPNGFQVGGIFWPAVLFVGITYAWVGARVIATETRNLVGWFILLGACVWAIDLFAEQYAWFAVQSARGLPGAPFADWLGAWFWQLGTVMILILMPITFPDGRLPSRRWRPVVVAVIVIGLISALADAIAILDPTEVPSLAGTVAGLGQAFVFFVGIPLGTIAVTVRWRASTGVLRLQLRWFVSAMALSAVCIVVQTVGYLTRALDGLIPAVLTLVAVALPVIAIGIAILRYRLYEIDRLVSRTIAYALVTGGLILVYLVINVALTTVFSSVTNDSVAVAASTLAVAALFQPLRRRVQRVVDRRFDRARYDAERTTAAFSERLRAEVDLAMVTADLGSTVRAAISPTTVGVWLRGGNR